MAFMYSLIGFPLLFTLTMNFLFLLIRSFIIILLISMFVMFFGIPSMKRYTEGKTMHVGETVIYSEEDAPGFLGKAC